MWEEFRCSGPHDQTGVGIHHGPLNDPSAGIQENTITIPWPCFEDNSPWGNGDRAKWTEGERERAMKAPMAESLQDLQTKVSFDQLIGGFDM